MSYILDALKKMEHEKTRKAGPAGMTKISGDLFMEGRPRPPQSGMWKLIAVAVVASLIAGAVTWIFLAPSRKTANVALHVTASPERTMVSPPAPPSASPALPQATVSPAAPSPPQQVSPPAPAQNIPSQASRPRQLPIDEAENSPEPRVLARHRRGGRVPALPSTAGEPVSVPTSATPTDIKVDGIAWQEERRARRAVVNGFLLKEGSVVSGARISEIRKDRVRFSQSGKSFEVTMTAPGASAPAPGSASNPGAPPSR